jgi:hypothetical protein
MVTGQVLPFASLKIRPDRPSTPETTLPPPLSTDDGMPPAIHAGRARKTGELRNGGINSPSLASAAQLTICVIDDQNPAPILRWYSKHHAESRGKGQGARGKLKVARLKSARPGRNSVLVIHHGGVPPHGGAPYGTIRTSGITEQLTFPLVSRKLLLHFLATGHPWP